MTKVDIDFNAGTRSFWGLPLVDPCHPAAMKNLYQRLLLLIAGATQRELARHVRYLKIENETLRSKLPKRVSVTPKEQNRLVKFGTRLGRAGPSTSCRSATQPRSTARCQCA